MKKFFAVIMTLCLMAGILAIPSFAANTDPETAIANATTITTENMAVLEAQYGTPVIDGNIDAVWSTAKWYKSHDEGIVTDEANIPNMVGYTAVLWDESNYYVIVYGKGWTNMEGGSPSNYVSMGFNIGKKHDVTQVIGTADYTSPYLWMTEQATHPDNINNYWQWCYAGFERLDVSQYCAFNKLSDDSFIIELQVPVTTLMASQSDKIGTEMSGITILDQSQEYNNKTGDKLGYHVGFYNRTNGMTKLQFAQINQYDIPSNWMTFTLKGEIPSQGGDDNQGGNDNQGGDDNQGGTSDDNGETADATSLVVFLGTVALAGAVIVSKKRH